MQTLLLHKVCALKAKGKSDTVSVSVVRRSERYVRSSHVLSDLWAVAYHALS